MVETKDLEWEKLLEVLGGLKPAAEELRQDAAGR